MRRSYSTNDVRSSAVDFSFTEALEHIRSLQTNSTAVSTIMERSLVKRGRELYQTVQLYRDLGTLISNPVTLAILRRYQDVEQTVFLRCLSVAIDFAQRQESASSYLVIALVDMLVRTPRYRQTLFQESVKSIKLEESVESLKRD